MLELRDRSSHKLDARKMLPFFAPLGETDKIGFLDEIDPSPL
ncbi:hypothetical protein PZN02_006402 (plasmid) [Sinorhizobium garamanticum]|uniref:Uncharacterized protein n=1 Tax=Sinorhizobium garamanticum TaxID=680247 RepID=A0ABY8DRJ3_9HYPH|nr:hypothetical protein [Sinorhizobium garamanticum]WEX91571.1 hypothetical protein PZN02_006402 [Sinorhizobium garamanticum]